MPTAKRALVIASPFGELRGPLNDAIAMADMLRNHDFEIDECYGPAATRKGILGAWDDLISRTSTGDTVVIYYTGHGGLVRGPRRGKDEPKSGKSEYQFLVPFDYNETSDNDFRGILDVEISYMLRTTTEKTRNVTVILDCCHAGKMFRDGSRNDSAHVKSLPEIQYHSITRFLTNLQQGGSFREDSFLNGNPHAVRIAAAATTESAWEYMNSAGEWRGVLTESLVRAIRETGGNDVSWRTVLFRVSQLVNKKFPTQNPRAEGPAGRALFSLQNIVSAALYIRLEEDPAGTGDRDSTGILEGGSVVGVRKGNTYSILPFSKEDADTLLLPQATVTAVNGFRSQVKLSFLPPWKNFQSRGGLALLEHEVFDKWPVTVPPDLEGLREAVEKSKFLRWQANNEHTSIEFQHEGGLVKLFNKRGVQIASQYLENSQMAPKQAFDEILTAAERLSRAQRIYGLQCEKTKEKLRHSLEVEVGIVENGQRIEKNEVTEGDHVYIRLQNKGISEVYASIFNVNVAGFVSSLTPHDPTGIEVLPDSVEGETIGEDSFGELKGLEVSWPQGIPKSSSVEEQYLTIVSNSPIDLQNMADSVNHDLSITRDTTPLPQKTINIRYDVLHIPITVHPLDTGYHRDSSVEDPQVSNKPAGVDQESHLASELPEPNDVRESNDLPAQPLTIAPKGLLGAIVRSRIPACVWVINQHHEEITVVVSRHRPNRMLSGVNISASTTGGSIGFETTTFEGPATRKTLPPSTQSDGESMAVFPLWTRKDGFGVVSVFKGPDKTPFIENDRIPQGATAYFVNKPDLRIVEYAGKDS